MSGAHLTHTRRAAVSPSLVARLQEGGRVGGDGGGRPLPGVVVLSLAGGVAAARKGTPGRVRESLHNA
jgi:hypothetical protein